MEPEGWPSPPANTLATWHAFSHIVTQIETGHKHTPQRLEGNGPECLTNSPAGAGLELGLKYLEHR